MFPAHIQQPCLNVYCLAIYASAQIGFSIAQLRLERGGGQQIALSCACFLITQPFFNIYRHAIHQMKAEYHSYLLVTIILYNSSEVKPKIVKEI